MRPNLYKKRANSGVSAATVVNYGERVWWVGSKGPWAKMATEKGDYLPGEGVGLEER